MTAPRFYVQSVLEVGQPVELSPDQAKQLRSVLRMRPGAVIVLFDGSGIEAQARITHIGRDGAVCDVTNTNRPKREPEHRLTVGLALLKPSNFELAAQKLTELGVARITPLVAERSVVSYRDAHDWAGRAARLARIVREAAEQSERVTLPQIDEPLDLEDFLQLHQVIALVERAHAPPLGQLEIPASVALAIGPEGGWSPAELELIAEHAGGLASMGTLILRAETAAIAAAAIALQPAPKGERDS